jgi:hypothetical protein
LSADVLGRRALNRALLARQLLLDRAPLGAADAVEHLVGLQGQAPDAPYVGLWSRLDGFAARELASLVEGREVVRAPLMRGTIHLVSAADARTLRPLVQPVLERAFAGNAFARGLGGADAAEVVAAGRALVEERPRTRAELGRVLADRWPAADPASLAHAVTFLAPLVQIHAPRRVAAARAGDVDDDRGMARPPAGVRRVARRARAPVPRGVRTGERDGRPGMVGPHAPR